MAIYSYTAVGRDGKHITGNIQASDRRNAVSVLAGSGRFVIELAEQTAAAGDCNGNKVSQATAMGSILKFNLNRISSRDVLAVTGQLGAALKAGLPLLNCLEIIRQQQHKPAMQKLFDDLVKLVSSGQSLSEAMARHPNVFSPLYLSMIRVGETGGILEQTMEQLIKILQRDEKVKISMRDASAYPIFVLTVGILSVIVVITWILPNILATISGGMEALPLPTKILLGINGFLRSYGLLTVIIAVPMWYLFIRWIRTSGRLKWDAFKLKVPILGSVMLSIAVGRFTKTLGALTKGGVTILDALKVVRDTLGNEFLAGQIDIAAEKIRAGASLAEPLSQSGYFPPLLIQIVSVGEQTGRLDELLLGAGDTFDEEADSAITRFIAVFPAILILAIALVIGFIIAATLLPIVMMELGGAVL